MSARSPRTDQSGSWTLVVVQVSGALICPSECTSHSSVVRRHANT